MNLSIYLSTACMTATTAPSRTSTRSSPPMCAWISALQAMRVVFTALATEQVSDAVESNSSHVSCNDAIRSPPSAGTYSEYNITAKSFDSDVCAASTLSETNRYSSSVCDESRRDDDYLLPFNSGSGMMYSTAFGQLLDRITKDRLRHEKQKQHSSSVLRSSTTATAGIAGASSSLTRYSNYCLLANRAPSSTPSSRPSYGYGSPTPAPTKFKGVKFSASQVSEKSSISVCLLVFR